MDSEQDNERLNEIAARASELDAGTVRDAYLDEACGDDPTVRAAVAGLLELPVGESARGGENDQTISALPAEDEASVGVADTLHGLLSVALAPAPEDEMSGGVGVHPGEGAGDRIGHYTLMEEIGIGGMGTVWLAEQSEPVKRRVALKIIKLGMDTREVVGRFEAERQALAMMDHAGIAKVFDAGATETGRPYFVMELVEGVAITSYCDEKRLGTRDRLRLFVGVCHAVQHAHQKGVIHRDIKPANILVSEEDGKPIAKVIDFGIAKAVEDKLTEQTIMTGIGRIIGTLGYMSPEQADAVDVDTRTDVYSLGVLLYELLSGRPPYEEERFRGAALDAALKIIRDEEPPRLSTGIAQLGDRGAEVASRRSTEIQKLARDVSGDLDWIVMRALEKDRERRYETANALALDVGRYLNDEVVAAGPPSATYRIGKFVRRNRAAIAAAAAMVLLLVAGIAVSVWQAVRATGEKRNAEAATLESRFNEGLGWLLRAEVAEERQKRYPETLLYAAQAIGFEGLGRPQGAEEPLRYIRQERNPAAFERARKWIAKRPGYRPIWASALRDSPASGLSVSASGRWLALASEDGRVAVWDMVSGSETEVLAAGSPSGPVADIAFDPMESTLAIALEEEVQIWGVAENVLLNQHPAGAGALAWSPGGDLLAAAAPDDPTENNAGGSELISVGDGWDYFKGSGAPSSPADAWKDLAFDVDPGVWSRGPSGLGYGDDDDATVLDDMVNQYSSVFIRKEFTIPSAPSGDGALELVIDYDDAFVAWLNGAEVARSDNIRSGDVDFRTMPASGNDHEAGTSEVVRLGLASELLDNGTNVLAIAGFNVSLESSDFSLIPSLRIASSPSFNGGSVRLWGGDAPATRLAAGLQTPAARLAYSAENSVIAAAYPGRGVRVFLPQSRADSALWADHAGDVTSIAVSPDGGRLAIGDADGAVSLWSVADAERLGIVPAELRHVGAVHDVAFRADGQQVASASADGTVKLWAVSGDIPVVAATLCGHVGAVSRVRYVPGGEALASVGADGCARLWWIGEEAGSQADLFAYLEQEFFAFDPGNQQVSWAGGSGFIGVPARSLTGLWQNGDRGKVADYLLAWGHWSAAGKLGADVSAALLADGIEAASQNRWLRVDLRLRQLAEVGGGEVTDAVGELAAARATATASEGESFTNVEGMVMVWCPATGEKGFQMGSPPEEADRKGIETLHTVVLSSGFWIGKYEVTQGEWEAVMGSNPSHHDDAGAKFPVENISWPEAVDFCRRLTYREGSRGTLPPGWEYALPSEAQWEYACRAGTTSAWSFGDDPGCLHEYGNCNDGVGGQLDGYRHAAPVGSYAANPWGLHDMHGNVYEWCQDAIGSENVAYGSGKVSDPLATRGSSRVLRGGGYKHDADSCRAAKRLADRLSLRNTDLGFRLAVVPLGRRPTIGSESVVRAVASGGGTRSGPPASAVSVSEVEVGSSGGLTAQEKDLKDRLRLNRETQGENSKYTLAAMKKLAAAYRANGREKLAAELEAEFADVEADE